MSASPSSIKNNLSNGLVQNLNPINPGFTTDLVFNRFEKLPAVKGVTANSVGVADIPTGDTYYALILQCLDGSNAATSIANIKTSITNIKLKLDGDEYWNLSPTDLFALQNYYGDNFAAGGLAGVLELDLAELRAQKERKYCEQLAYGTANLSSMTLEITFGTLTSLASINVFAIKSRTRKPLGACKKVLTYSRTFASTGDQEIDTLPKSPNRIYRALHFDVASGALNSVSMKVNGDAIRDAIPSVIVQNTDERNGKNPQTGYHHVDFNPHGEPLGGLPMQVNTPQGLAPVSDLRTTLNWGTSPGGVYRIIAETYETP